MPATLAALNVPIGVATNCSEALGRRAVGRLGAPVAVVASAERAGAYKPDPAPYRLAATELGLPPARVLFVAGSPHDIAGARGVGMPVVWVNRLGTEPPAGAGDVVILPDLRRLPALIGAGAA